MLENSEIPIRCKYLATVADTFLMDSASNSGCLPNPTTTTLSESILPKVCTSVISLSFPLISLSLIKREIAPFNDLSTAPVEPPGFVTPSNRLTTIALDLCSTILPTPTVISMSAPKANIHTSINHYIQENGSVLLTYSHAIITLHHHKRNWRTTCQKETALKKKRQS